MCLVTYLQFIQDTNILSGSMSHESLCIDFKALRTHKDVKFSLDIQRKQLPVGRLLIDPVQETLYFTATQDQHFDYGKNILLQLILYLF